ncbi:hypothetical protein LR48_Vigan11g060200 [Vigna angularis]|uniref:Uncharacterized protein n=1 Tax=Phaseolus angularis TaxID=3914 RepID=A0A0L9VS52_PHAAN|nr:hypothetical protein LR48_Vigan11g060200 [Vigna angularis]
MGSQPPPYHPHRRPTSSPSFLAGVVTNMLCRQRETAPSLPLLHREAVIYHQHHEIAAAFDTQSRTPWILHRKHLQEEKPNHRETQNRAAHTHSQSIFFARQHQSETSMSIASPPSSRTTCTTQQTTNISTSFARTTIANRDSSMDAINEHHRCRKTSVTRIQVLPSHSNLHDHHHLLRSASISSEKPAPLHNLHSENAKSRTSMIRSTAEEKR